MTDQAAAAAAAMFADPNITVEAVYTPLSGVAPAVPRPRVIFRRPTGEVGAGGNVAIAPGRFLKVLKSDIPALVKGDRFEVQGESLKVARAPKLDELQVWWMAQLEFT